MLRVRVRVRVRVMVFTRQWHDSFSVGGDKARHDRTSCLKVIRF